VRRALPPVGWHSITEHEPHSTTVWAWLNTVVMLKQPGHLTSMKYELGACTRRRSLCLEASSAAEGCRRSRGCSGDKKTLVSAPDRLEDGGVSPLANFSRGCELRLGRESSTKSRRDPF
jgi:hypothetical protein